MASFIEPAAKSAAYRGLNTIFEFTNDDGLCQQTNCGQAAAATLLTHLGQFHPQPELASRIMQWLESRHPPDNLFGLFGTSRIQVKRACQARGVRLREIQGEAKLRRALDRDRPVIVMLQVPAGKFWKWELPGGHWMVAFGYDDEHLYLTNWGAMTWESFRTGWRGLVPRLIGMCGKGLTPA